MGSRAWPDRFFPFLFVTAEKTDFFPPSQRKTEKSGLATRDYSMGPIVSVVTLHGQQNQL